MLWFGLVWLGLVWFGFMFCWSSLLAACAGLICWIVGLVCWCDVCFLFEAPRGTHHEASPGTFGTPAPAVSRASGRGASGFFGISANPATRSLPELVGKTILAAGNKFGLFPARKRGI